MSPVRSSIRNFFSGEITVGENSWHYRFYKWWLAHGGGNRWNYKENLCHYMRAVLIWVPLFWFFREPIKWWIRPWMIAAAIGIPIGTWLAYQIWPDRVLTIYAIIGLSALYATGLTGLYALRDYNKKYPERKAAKITNIVINILLLPVYVVAIPIIFLYDHVFQPYGKRFFRWYFTRHTLVVIYPWTVTAAALLVLSLVFLGPWITLLIAVGITTVVIGIVAIVLLIFGLLNLIDKIINRMMRRKFDRPYSSPRKSGPKGASTLQIFAQAVMAKKRMICPFIKLPKTVSSNGGLYHNLPEYGGMEK